MWFEYYIYVYDGGYHDIMWGYNEVDAAKREGLNPGEYKVLKSYRVER